MSGPEYSDLLVLMRNKHIATENIIQKLCDSVLCGACSNCDSVCCKEEICRESMDSTFLRYIVGDKVKLYDASTGWHKKEIGCILEHGRPFVCYEFFCSKLQHKTGLPELKYLINMFQRCYSKALGNRHMVTLSDIHLVSANKFKTMLGNINQVYALANAALQRRS